MKAVPKILFLLPWVLFGAQTDLTGQDPFLEPYHVVWTEPSKDVSESMPLVGGDMGCNVWVENGDLLMYVQRSGSLSENGEYLKLGRIRLQLHPDPFTQNHFFRQELKLRDGYMEITAGSARGKEGQGIRIRLWVEIDRPIVHIDVESDTEIEVVAAYENWRTEDKELLDVPQGSRERFTCFNLEGYPGKVIRVKDEIGFSKKGILFYHRNPAEKLLPDLLIRQQGLEAYADDIYDDLEDRTFGGLLLGKGFIPAGTGEGSYQITPFRSWKIKSRTAGKAHHIALVTHIGQAETLEEWNDELMQTAASLFQDRQISFNKTLSWWHQFWDRSYIVIRPDKADPSDPVWQMGRNYQLFRYQLGGNAFGEYPTKFNGGNLIYDPVLVNENSRYEPVSYTHLRAHETRR